VALEEHKFSRVGRGRVDAQLGNEGGLVDHDVNEFAVLQGLVYYYLF
jgi:hypothetical protein